MKTYVNNSLKIKFEILEELILHGIIYLQVEKCDYKRDIDFVSN